MEKVKVSVTGAGSLLVDGDPKTILSWIREDFHKRGANTIEAKRGRPKKIAVEEKA